MTTSHLAESMYCLKVIRNRDDISNSCNFHTEGKTQNHWIVFLLYHAIALCIWLQAHSQPEQQQPQSPATREHMHEIKNIFPNNVRKSHEKTVT